MNEITSISQLKRLVTMAKTIGITGYPGAGKTTLMNLLGETGKKLIHSDDFIPNRAHEEIPQAILKFLPKTNYIVEGTQVARLLSRGFSPDLLLLVEGSDRHIKDPKYSAGIRAMIDKKIENYSGLIYRVNPRELLDVKVSEKRWREMTKTSQDKIKEAFNKGG